MTSRTIRQRIEAFNADRDPIRLERKYRAMSTDPFVFFRGTAHLFWEDWARQAGTLADAPLAWVCGDLHLENFGSFLGDNRLVYFDLNDFDEAALAPATTDVVRLLTSTYLAARSLELSGADCKLLTERYLDAYREALVDGKARWVERATAKGMVRDLLCKARQRRRKALLASRTDVVNGRRRIRIDGERAFAIGRQERAHVVECIHAFAESSELTPSRYDPRWFHVLDVAGRIAGTGSLGLRRYVVLTRGHGDTNGGFLIDVKQVGASALAINISTPQPKWRSAGERVVSIQHRTQAISPALLSPVTIDGTSFVLRELQPTEDRLALGHWNGKLGRLKKVLGTMGHVTAWSQLRSASRQGSASLDELIAFGRSRSWSRRAIEYARQYAQQAERDWRAFVGS